MIPLNALVIYKTKPAIVKECAEDRYFIFLEDGSKVKVREKDIELLYPGPVTGFNQIDKIPCENEQVFTAWELLSGQDNQITLKELASIIFDDFSPVSVFSAYCILQDGLYFTGTPDCIKPRRREEIEAAEVKRNEKKREDEERSEFLTRCRKNRLTKEDLEKTSRFLQDVEALALGKSAKSRTLKELNISETPEDAHAFLLKTGIWTEFFNPHPARFGLSPNALQGNLLPRNSLRSNDDSLTKDGEPSIPSEDRTDLCRLPAFAIDNSWSDDPDDAVSIEKDGNDFILFVHVADPASIILPGSPEETEARNRGATLYLPEATVRMLDDKYLSVFALGLNAPMEGKSPVLSFKLTINGKGEITNTDIFPSFVKVTRLTYEEAVNCNNEDLRALDDLAQLLYDSRCRKGAVDIDLPDVHITVENGKVKIEPSVQNRAFFMVRECMIAAGAGAGTWASKRSLAMPYISQEAEIPDNLLLNKKDCGIAGSMQLRKCMRQRVISVKPGRHQGLGQEIYIQVTSPLRRYTDLLSHMQIRSVLGGSAPLSADEVSARIGYSEAGALACVYTERASVLHWKMVYLKDKIDSVWEGVVVEKKGNRHLVVIPALALETLVSLKKDISPNGKVGFILKSVNIPKGEAVFVQA